MIQNLLHNLNIDPVLLLGNAILFVILLAVLNAMFWKPMMRHLEQRKHDIENAYICAATSARSVFIRW